MKKLLLTTVILFTFALLQGQNYTFEDFILDKLPGDPFYAELEKQKQSNP